MKASVIVTLNEGHRSGVAQMYKGGRIKEFEFVLKPEITIRHINEHTRTPWYKRSVRKGRWLYIALSGAIEYALMMGADRTHVMVEA